MNSTPRDPSPRGLSSSGSNFDPVPLPALLSIEDTLYLISHAPIPDGLEERVRAALRAAPCTTGKVLGWPAANVRRPAAAWMGSGWMRTAAAAAIVFVVAGGGWGVYTRVERPQTKVIAMPPSPTAAPSGFSSAGAMRTPQTIPGPVAAHHSKRRAATKSKKIAAPLTAAHTAAATAVAQPAAPRGK